MKHAVYSGTRNLYDGMETAAKSLYSNSTVDKIWFLIEDRCFPKDLPDFIECVDVSGQAFFPKKCANIRTQFSYMSLLRVCYTRLLPQDVHKVLQLDVDTVCVDDVDGIWDADLTDCWCAMTEEHLGTFKPYGRKYFNAGVALFDLDKMRDEKIDEWLINFLNEVEVPYIDQDAANRYGNIANLEVKYNECFVTGYTESPVIVHFAGIKDWQTSPRAARREYLKKYREMTWKEAKELHAVKLKGVKK